MRYSFLTFMILHLVCYRILNYNVTILNQNIINNNQNVISYSPKLKAKEVEESEKGFQKLYDSIKDACKLLKPLISSGYLLLLTLLSESCVSVGVSRYRHRNWKYTLNYVLVDLIRNTENKYDYTMKPLHIRMVLISRESRKNTTFVSHCFSMWKYIQLWM